MPRRFLARLVVWAMVALVPVQAVAAAALATLGPLHGHRAPAQTTVLEDVRRVAGSHAALPRHVATAFGHFHGAALERHHHARDDGSVVAVDDGSGALDGESAPAGAALAAAIGVCADLAAWCADRVDHVRQAQRAWASLTHDPPFPERPPRAD